MTWPLGLVLDRVYCQCSMTYDWIHTVTAIFRWIKAMCSLYHGNASIYSITWRNVKCCIWCHLSHFFWYISDQFLSLVSCCMFTNYKTQFYKWGHPQRVCVCVCACVRVCDFCQVLLTSGYQFLGTHTYTHTHTGIPIIMMTFHRSNGFYSILYKLYIISPYTNPILKNRKKVSQKEKDFRYRHLWGTFCSHN